MSNQTFHWDFQKSFTWEDFFESQAGTAAKFLIENQTVTVSKA